MLVPGQEFVGWWWRGAVKSDSGRRPRPSLVEEVVTLRRRRPGPRLGTPRNSPAPDSLPALGPQAPFN